MTRAVIICGGKGERLEPLTREIPKMMIPFRGKPLLEQSVYNYWKHSVWEIWLSLGHMSDKIIEQYPYPPIFEKTPLGTGGWLKLLKTDEGLLNNFKQEDFYVNNGDTIRSSAFLMLPLSIDVILLFFMALIIPSTFSSSGILPAV